MQETPVQFLVWEGPTCVRAVEPMRHNYWSLNTLDPVLHKRGYHKEKPVHGNKRKSGSSNENPAQLKINEKKKKLSLDLIRCTGILDWIQKNYN